MQDRRLCQRRHHAPARLLHAAAPAGPAHRLRQAAPVGRRQLGHRGAAGGLCRDGHRGQPRLLCRAGGRDGVLAVPLLPAALSAAAHGREDAAGARGRGQPPAPARGRHVLPRHVPHGHPHGPDHGVPVCVPGGRAGRAAVALWRVPGRDVRHRGALLLLLGPPHQTPGQRRRPPPRPAHLHPPLRLLLVPGGRLARPARRGPPRPHLRRLLGREHRLCRVHRPARPRGVHAGLPLWHPLVSGWGSMARYEKTKPIIAGERAQAPAPSSAALCTRPWAGGRRSGYLHVWPPQPISCSCSPSGSSAVPPPKWPRKQLPRLRPSARPRWRLPPRGTRRPSSASSGPPI